MREAAGGPPSMGTDERRARRLGADTYRAANAVRLAPRRPTHGEPDAGAFRRLLKAVMGSRHGARRSGTMFPMPTKKEASKEIAFYYPGSIWHESEWIKTLILFFDGIGILLPNYLAGKPEYEDPSIAIPLREKGLLHMLEPEKIIDAAATKQLCDTMEEIIRSGALDKLPKDVEYHAISYSRMGGYGDEKIARDLLQKLKAKGLARDTEDGESIPIHPMVRCLILVLLSQILRPHGKDLGAELSPATDRPNVVNALQDLLSLPGTPSSGHVVAMDVETVTVDLRLVPLDEILDFRKEHFNEHREYIRSLRKATRELSQLPEKDREHEMDARREELQELANSIKTTSRKAWKRPASFGLGIAGAFWKLSRHDYLGALLADGGALLGLKSKDKVDTGAYSYLFRANRGT